MDALYVEGVVIADNLLFIESERPDGGIELVRLDGYVFTTDGGVLETHKRLVVDHDGRGAPLVWTMEYVYMGLRKLAGRSQKLFRYDNCHGTADTLHRHHFDYGGEPAGSEEVPPDLMPYMDDVIRETAWLAAHLAQRSN